MTRNRIYRNNRNKYSGIYRNNRKRYKSNLKDKKSKNRLDYKIIATLLLKDIYFINLINLHLQEKCYSR